VSFHCHLESLPVDRGKNRKMTRKGGFEIEKSSDLVIRNTQKNIRFNNKKNLHKTRRVRPTGFLEQGRREGGDRGVSYPGPRDNGGAPQCFRMIFCNHLS